LGDLWKRMSQSDDGEIRDISMKVLVVGNTSVLGMRIGLELSRCHDVKTAGRNGSSDVFFDLRTGPGPDVPVGLDAIVHCAASFQGDTLAEMIENEELNSVGALRVAKLAQVTECKHLIYVSTISVLDHPDNGYFGSYALSKRHAQESLQLWCRKADIAFTALLPSQVYDETGKARKHQPLLYHIVDRARFAENVSLFGTADPLRNYLYVGDLATAVEHVISRGTQGIFPCLAPDSHPISDVARIAFEVFGTKGQITRLPDCRDIPKIHIPNDDSLFDATGYRPTTELRQGLTKIRDYVAAS
jgi:nucleoside-diphosphate-sugar epimerase